MKELVEVLQGKTSKAIILSLALDEAGTLSTSSQPPSLRRQWGPRETEDGSLSWSMPDYAFPLLAGTGNQLATLAPLPRTSGSGRLEAGTYYLCRPFTVLFILCYMALYMTVSGAIP